MLFNHGAVGLRLCPCTSHECERLKRGACLGGSGRGCSGCGRSLSYRSRRRSTREERGESDGQCSANDHVELGGCSGRNVPQHSEHEGALYDQTDPVDPMFTQR